MKTEIASNPEVSVAIKAACEASNSMFGFIRDAADIASQELNMMIPIGDSLAEVTGKYAEDFGDNHNLKALFKDCLTCHYGMDAPISFTVGKGDLAKEIHTTGNDAAQMSKHKMQAGAKVVREANGVGRKEGGGRTPRTPEAPKVADWTVTFNELMVTDEGLAQIKSLLVLHGFQLRKAPVKATS